MRFLNVYPRFLVKGMEDFVPKPGVAKTIITKTNITLGGQNGNWLFTSIFRKS